MPNYELDEWVAVLQGRLLQPSLEYLVITFPDEQIRKAYLSTAAERAEEEVRSVLRVFLGSSRTVDVSDQLHFEILKTRLSDPGEVARGALRHRLTEYDRRVIRHFVRESATPTWEGLTWVIDLLPHFPQQAVAAIQAYLLAHAQILPDLRIDGLTDAVDLIRACYIAQGGATTEGLQELLLSLDARDFEFLVATLYRAMGYEVVVTPAQKDGGKDVIATKRGEVLYIECKNWRGRVDSDVVAGLTGRVEIDRVTRGIVIGVSGFTRGRASASAVAAKSPARILLIDGAELVTHLNTHLGSEWHRQAERLIQAERIAQAHADQAE